MKIKIGECYLIQNPIIPSPVRNWYFTANMEKTFNRRPLIITDSTYDETLAYENDEDYEREENPFIHFEGFGYEKEDFIRLRRRVLIL